MKHWMGAALAVLVAGTAAACGTTGPRADQAQPGVGLGETRHLMATDQNLPPTEAASPEEAMKQAPARLSKEEGDRLLLKLDEKDLVMSPTGEANSYRYGRWGRGYGWGRGLGYWGRGLGWGLGYAPYWGGAWGAYNYLPVGSYYFPYSLIDGSYVRYASTYSPYFYRWRTGLWPFYNRLWL